MPGSGSIPRTPASPRDARDPFQAGEFFGDVVARHRVSEITLTELHHRARRSFPRHSHEHTYFCLLLAGGYAEEIAGRSVPQRPMTVAFHPAGIEHRDEVGEGGARFFGVEVGTRWIERLREEAKAPLDFATLGAGDGVWLSARLHRELWRREESSPLVIEGLVLELLAAVCRELRPLGRRPPGWVARIEELLREGFRESWTLDGLAAEAGVHPVHLSRAFRRFHGRTPGEYLLDLRVRHVCERLADPDIPLADLALEAGFADQSHCTRVFKRLTGTTPGAFRASSEPRKASRDIVEK